MELTQGFEAIIRENESLAPYTRLRIGGVAEYFAEPTTVEQLCNLVRRFQEADLPVRLLGGGCNLLIRDEGTPGLVIHLAAPVFCKLEKHDKGILAGGGTRLSHFVSLAVGEGFAGPENLTGIPGTVGGALNGNAGNQSAAIGSWIVKATAVTRKGELVTRERNEMTFAHRESSLNELVIVDATFQFEQDDADALSKRLQKQWIVKKAQQPGSELNSVYVFKDHGGVPAGQLIDQAGLRGTRIGEVEISSKDPNFFVAAQGASSDDVLRLVDLVRSRVSDRLGINLEQSLVVW